MRIKVDLMKCTGCRLCMSACGMIHNPEGRADPALSAIRIQFDQFTRKDKVLVCYQCQRAPCVSACEVNALYLENGIVKYDASTCIGCEECLDACPFGVIFPFPSTEKIIKCDLCVNYQVRYCEMVCPVQAISVIGRKKNQRSVIPT